MKRRNNVENNGMKRSTQDQQTVIQQIVEKLAPLLTGGGQKQFQRTWLVFLEPPEKLGAVRVLQGGNEGFRGVAAAENDEAHLVGGVFAFEQDGPIQGFSEYAPDRPYV